MDILFGFGYYGYGFNHWYGRNEKSSHASNRENIAKKKFDAMKKTMEACCISGAIEEGRAAGSNSHLKFLPVDALNNVYGYLLGKDFENDEDADISNHLDKTLPRLDHRVRTKKRSVGVQQFDIDFKDLSLYEPGNKITIHLTMPNFHLTGPCFRDLKKHVKKSPGWDLKRIACSEAEKVQHKVTRKSNAYFVNAIYTVPGTLKKKKKNRKSSGLKAAATARKTSNQDMAKYKCPPNPGATAALQAALASAQDNDGVIEPKCLNKTLSFGFSKAFLDAKVEEQEELNVKPAAKKLKTEQ